MITMAAMSQVCAMITTMIDRCMIVGSGDRSGMLLMIAAVLGSPVVVLCRAMVS
jgi:hypothetical protein